MKYLSLDKEYPQKVRNKLSLVFSVFLIFLITSPALSKTDWRCGIRLVFDSDGKGSVANYILGLQVKNTTGRNINGVSIIYKDSQSNVIGNAFLNCSVDLKPVKPGSYGECTRVLQRVDGEYIKSFGVQKWTEIVNNQLEILNSIQHCEVLGFSY